MTDIKIVYKDKEYILDRQQLETLMDYARVTANNTLQILTNPKEKELVERSKKIALEIANMIEF